MATTLKSILHEGFAIIPNIVPSDIDAAQTTDWIDVRDFHEIGVLWYLGAGAAANLTLQQATTAAGGSAKTLSFDGLYQNTTAASNDLFSFVSSSGTDTHAASTAASIYLIPVDISTMDLAGGFFYLKADISDPGSARIGTGLYVGRRKMITSDPVTVLT